MQMNYPLPRWRVCMLRTMSQYKMSATGVRTTGQCRQCLEHFNDIIGHMVLHIKVKPGWILNCGICGLQGITPEEIPQHLNARCNGEIRRTPKNWEKVTHKVLMLPPFAVGQIINEARFFDRINGVIYAMSTRIEIELPY